MSLRQNDVAVEAFGCLAVAGAFGLWLVYVCAWAALVVGAAVFVWKHI